MAKAYTVKCFLLLVLATILSSGTIRADVLPLPGHQLNLDEKAKHCYGALVATFEKAEVDDMGPTGAADYGSHWKVIHVLRGTYAPETSLLIRVQSLPKEHGESLPIPGKNYILIGYGPEIAHQQMAIILEDTPENLEKVKKLLQP